jgi:hypothetical protein
MVPTGQDVRPHNIRDGAISRFQQLFSANGINNSHEFAAFGSARRES